METSPTPTQEILERNAKKGLLRFSVVGSVDDGKSTMIGRLLHDSKNLFDDHLTALRKASKTFAGGEIDFSLVTDGLKAEREQGITIDVAYRYFSTSKRAFIIADTPGHEQYTRNMATGASTASLALLLIDSRHGILTQTRRHSFVASLLGIPRLLIAINKMDLVGYAEERFAEIRAEYTDFVAKLGITELKFIPISALHGDNIVEGSPKMPWYRGESILEYLENVYVDGDRNLVDFRFPVQNVIRPHQDFRGFAGQIASGSVRVGDELMVLPSGRRSRLKSISSFDGELQEVFAPMSVCLRLEDEIDVSRGEMLVRPNNVPQAVQDFEAMIVWLSEKPMDPDKPILIKHTTRTTKAHFGELRYRVNVNTLHREETKFLRLNEIGRVVFHAHSPLFVDPYAKNRCTGSFIIIDPVSNATLAA
ncbi:MAG: sulfate adenylyltransferase subunit CysN, partial [Bdellovibrionales bacterium]